MSLRWGVNMRLKFTLNVLFFFYIISNFEQNFEIVPILIRNQIQWYKLFQIKSKAEVNAYLTINLIVGICPTNKFHKISLT